MDVFDDVSESVDSCFESLHTDSTGVIGVIEAAGEVAEEKVV